MNTILAKNADRFRSEPFSSTDGDAIFIEISALAEAVKTYGPKDKDLKDSVKNAAWLASFAAQHAANSTNLPDATRIFLNAREIVNAMVSVLNAATKPNTFQPFTQKEAGLLFLELDTVTRTTIQKQPGFADIPAPPQIAQPK
jgi:hypothetical protein